jgi:hypothetical protein
VALKKQDVDKCKRRLKRSPVFQNHVKGIGIGIASVGKTIEGDANFEHGRK